MEHQKKPTETHDNHKKPAGANEKPMGKPTGTMETHEKPAETHGTQ